jgi:hypothetical protein
MIDEEVKLFRKGLSTIVETALEGIEEKPFTHFINNAMSTINCVKNSSQFAKEAYHAQQNDMIKELKDEMIRWYIGVGYKKEIVEIVVDYISDIVFISIGGTYAMVEAIKDYKNKEPKEA